MQLTRKSLALILMYLLTAALLSACGGGSASGNFGDDDSSVSTAADPCITDSALRVCATSANQLQFFWDKVDGADFYRFYVDTGDAPREQIGEDIAAIEAAADEIIIRNFIFPIEAQNFDWTNALFDFEVCSYNTEAEALTDVTCDIQDYQSVRGLDRFAVRQLQSSIGGGTNFAISSAISKDGLLLAVGANLNSTIFCPVGFGEDVLDVVEVIDGENVWVDIADEFCERRKVANKDYYGDIDDPLYNGDLEEDDPDYQPEFFYGSTLEDTINSSGAVFLYERFDTNEPFSFFPSTTLWSPNREEGDNFGFSVAVSKLDDGTRLVAVAAPAEDGDGGSVALRDVVAEDEYCESLEAAEIDQCDNDALEAGAVYIFSGDPDPVVEENLDLEPDERAKDKFSKQARKRWFAREPGEDLLPSDPEYLGPLFDPVYLKASNVGAGDLFGYEVDFSKNGEDVIFLAVAAPGEASANGNPLDNSAKCAGAVYVFESGAGSWSETAYLKASTPSTRDVFGQSLSLDADGLTLAVGASQLPNLTFLGDCYANPPSSSAEYLKFIADQAKSSDPGEAYIFDRTDDSAWTVANNMPLVAPGRSNGDSFGNSVSLSGDGKAVAVGAPFVDNEFYEFKDRVPAGAAYKFTNNNDTSWKFSFELEAPDTQALIQLFGATVKLNGDGSLLGIGATGKCTFNLGLGGNADFIDCGGFGATGAAYLYKNREQLVFINPPVPLPSGSRFGSGIDFAEDDASLVINARRAGTVFIY